MLVGYSASMSTIVTRRNQKCKGKDRLTQPDSALSSYSDPRSAHPSLHYYSARAPTPRLCSCHRRREYYYDRCPTAVLPSPVVTAAMTVAAARMGSSLCWGLDRRKMRGRRGIAGLCYLRCGLRCQDNSAQVSSVNSLARGNKFLSIRTQG